MNSEEEGVLGEVDQRQHIDAGTEEIRKLKVFQARIILIQILVKLLIATIMSN